MEEPIIVRRNSSIGDNITIGKYGVFTSEYALKKVWFIRRYIILNIGLWGIEMITRWLGFKNKRGFILNDVHIWDKWLLGFVTIKKYKSKESSLEWKGK